MAYPSQHIDIEIPHGSRNHVIVAGTIKSMFNIDIESTNKTRSIVKNVSRTLVKKRGRWYSNSSDQGKCNQKDFW